MRGRVRLKCDGTRAETRFHLSPKRTSPFKSAGASVQSTASSRGVRIGVTPRSEVVWEYWLPTPFASFPFTSPSVRHRVPSGSKRTLLQNSVLCGRPHTYRKDTGHEGMQGEQKKSTAHSESWYYTEAEVNSRPSQLEHQQRTDRPSTHCGLMADPKLDALLSKRHKSHASTRNQNVLSRSKTTFLYQLW